MENVKNTIVPQSLRSDFGQLINEYVRFNEESRNNIMERMTPNYMYEDIGKVRNSLEIRMSCFPVNGVFTSGKKRTSYPPEIMGCSYQH